jgi:hypothetical protein
MRVFAGRRIGRRGILGVSVNPVNMIKGTGGLGASLARQFPWAAIVAFIGLVFCIGLAVYMRFAR